jgi:glyoxylase-like metal-dependent hydrolase (beta-lactamase superfamily II)
MVAEVKIFAGCAAVILMAISLHAKSDEGPFQFEFQEIGSGVWVGVRPDSPRYPVMGNTTFVISDEGVVVFDGGGMPVMAEQIIAKIRMLTDKPVTHVVISHWHGDHNFGVYRFAEEFPDVQFVAHKFTNEVFNSSRISYIDRQRNFIDRNREEFENIVATGKNSEGEVQSEADRKDYARIIEDAGVIEPEFNRARVTPANIVFKDDFTIKSGDRTIKLLHLGHANTAGDIVMWLAEERIVATGDIVVLPSPYAFNVPPRAWAETLRALNNLNYDLLVPGHGEIQSNTAYVDLIIETADAIADQRDAMLASGMSNEAVEAGLDFSAYETRFTQGDEYVKSYYDAYFEGPFRKATMKALTGEPMVRIEPPEPVPFDDERWQIEAAEVEIVDYLGQQALKIRGGAAMLPDMDITNGLVEFDIAVSQERGFAGLIFRSQDDANFEHFYIRPHQSGNPDANQYTPVFNGVSAWQLYHGAGYGAPVEYRYNEWMHVKIIFAGSKAKVYIDSDEPVLYIDDLKRDEMSGAIGVHSADFSSVHFANFKFTTLADAYEFPAAGPKSAEANEGLVTAWQVSDVFDGASLKGIAELGAEHKSGRTWTELSAESTGITNLARVNGLGENSNTVFARVVVTTEQPGVKELKFGYSDAVAVFVNDTLIYKGNNSYLTRDYRYLGTIGLFDSVVLPLQAGENEIWIAVSEAFGGWGIKATITDLH